MTGIERIEALRKTRPDTAIAVEWEIDPYFRWDGDGPAPWDEAAHNVTVTASAIREGRLVVGYACLGRCYSPIGGPHCPEVHGYLPQLIEEALQKLDGELKEAVT